MQISKEWFVIINSAADSGRIKTDWPEIESILRKKGFSFEAAFTQHKYHAVELTVNAVNKGFRKIIVVGGDGTLNEVVNGLFIQTAVSVSEVTTGIIPALSVFRHARLKSIPQQYSEAIDTIASEYFSLLNIITVSYHKANYRQSRYFLTSARTGLDANIVKRMAFLREEGRYGWLRQWLTAVRLIFKYRQTKTTIYVNERKVTLNRLTSALIRTRKSGCKQTEADKIEIATLGTVRRWLLVFNIKRLRSGQLYNMRSAIRHYGNTIRIESESTLSLSADGEMLGYSPFDFTMANQSVRIIFPPKSAHYHPDGSPK